MKDVGHDELLSSRIEELENADLDRVIDEIVAEEFERQGFGAVCMSARFSAEGLDGLQMMGRRPAPSQRAWHRLIRACSRKCQRAESQR